MKQRRVKIVMGNEFLPDRIVDAETGEDLITTATGITIWCDKSTNMRPVAKITIIDPEIEVDASIAVETTVRYTHLEKKRPAKEQGP